MGSSSSVAAMEVVLLLPLLLAPLVDSNSDASTFPILSHINRLNPEGPHFTLPAIRPFVDFGNSAAGYYPKGSLTSTSSLYPPSSTSSTSFSPSSLFLPSSSTFPAYLSSSYPRANQVTGFRGSAIGIGPGKYAAYRKSDVASKQKNKKFDSGKEKIVSKLSKLDPRILGSSKSPSLYEALRNRASMGQKSLPQTAALLKSTTEEVISNNSLDEFPVSFHPEEELARKG